MGSNVNNHETLVGHSPLSNTASRGESESDRIFALISLKKSIDFFCQVMRRSKDVRLLLDNGANIYGEFPDEPTAAWYAVEFGMIFRLEILI